jgi:hypothetical protein
VLLDEQSPKRRPADATVRIGTAWAIPDVLRSLGADPAEVLAKAGMDLALFSDPDNLISFSARGSLIRVCVDATGCRHFGLLIGQQGGLHSLGLVGLLAKNSVDVATAIQSLVRYFSVHSRGSVTRLEVDGDVALLSFSVLQPDIEAVDQACDVGGIGLAQSPSDAVGCGCHRPVLRRRPVQKIAPGRSRGQGPWQEWWRRRDSLSAPFGTGWTMPSSWQARMRGVLSAAPALVRARPPANPSARPPATRRSASL